MAIKRVFYFVLWCFLPILAHGKTFSFFILSTEQRLVETQAKEYSFLPLSNFAFSYTYFRHQLLIERTELESHSGNSTLNFSESTRENHINYLYQVAPLSNYWFLYGGIGTGFYNTTVITRFSNQENNENSGNTLFLSGLVSLQFIYGYFHAHLDFRVIEAKDYSPQPQPSFILRTGISF